MKFAEVSDDIRGKIASWRWDRIIEKHEGPHSWESTLRYSDVDFLEVEEKQILLPLDSEQRNQLEIRKIMTTQSQNEVILYLINHWYKQFGYKEQHCGFIAICEKFPEQNFFVATAYHEWFVIENQ